VLFLISDHKVSVALLDLPCEFEHFTVPKMIPNAYLKAKLTNKSKFLFLQGPSNIFVDNNFMTKVLRLCYHSSSSVIHWVTQVFDIW